MQLNRNLLQLNLSNAQPLLARTTSLGSSSNSQVSMTSSRKSSAILSGNAEWFEPTPGERFTIRTSTEAEGNFTILEVVADPRNGMAMHIHKNEDEHFIVLAGTLRIANGETTLDARAGTAVTVSKGTPHAWCNLSDTPVRMLIIFSPGYIEGLFRETVARKSDDEIAAIADSHCWSAVARRSPYHHHAAYLKGRT
jgi:mannose-6-phosphate isomerase-like protein (cupin superfamily)